MNIMYILSSTSTTGGATKSFINLLKELIKMGINAWIVVPSATGIYFELSQMPIHVIVIPIRNSSYPDCRNLVYSLTFPIRLSYWKLLNLYSYFKLRKIAKDNMIDIIHTNVSILNVGNQVAHSLYIPHVYHVREYGDKDFNIHYYPTYKRFLNTISKSYSICITKDIQRHHHLESNVNSIVIYNGIMPKSAMSSSNSKESFFLYAGRIEKAKGLLDLIHAYKKYSLQSKKPYILKVAGKINDNAYYKQINEYIEKNGLKEHIKFLGPVRDIKSLLNKAAAIVIPSHSEGFGRCMAEAMFNDCLVVGKNTAGTKEQFDNGLQVTGCEIGLRYTTNNELASLLLQIQNSSNEDLQKYRDKAAITVTQLYTTEQCAKETYQFYKKILHEKNI